MFSLIKQLFDAPETPDAEAPDHAERVKVATCVVLLEAARADKDFGDEERLHIVETLRSRFDLSAGDAEELIGAATSARDESVDLWSFTNHINQGLTLPEKIEIIEEVWRVMFADGSLDGHEDVLIHKLSRLLNVTHKELIEAKLRVRAEGNG